MLSDGAWEWHHPSMTPYDVLGVTNSSSIGEIRTAFKRRALETHPDKAGVASQRTALPFTVVKEAAQILLDPLVRRSYDAHLSQRMVREAGAVSDVYSLMEDFACVASPSHAEGGEASDAVWMYEMECRCGGIYEVVLFTNPTDSQRVVTSLRGQPHTVRCECDSCSLIIEVTL